MDENLFEKYKDLLEQDGIEAHSKLSQEWFYDRIREINNPTRLYFGVDGHHCGYSDAFDVWMNSSSAPFDV